MTSKKTWRTVESPPKEIYKTLDEITREIDDADQTNPRWYLVPTGLVSNKTGQQIFCIGQPYRYLMSNILHQRKKNDIKVLFYRISPSNSEKYLSLRKNRGFRLLQIQNPSKQYRSEKCIPYGPTYHFERNQEDEEMTANCFEQGCIKSSRKRGGRNLRKTRKRKIPKILQTHQKPQKPQKQFAK